MPGLNIAPRDIAGIVAAIVAILAMIFGFSQSSTPGGDQHDPIQVTVTQTNSPTTPETPATTTSRKPQPTTATTVYVPVYDNSTSTTQVTTTMYLPIFNGTTWVTVAVNPDGKTLTPTPPQEPTVAPQPTQPAPTPESTPVPTTSIVTTTETLAPATTTSVVTVTAAPTPTTSVVTVTATPTTSAEPPNDDPLAKTHPPVDTNAYNGPYLLTRQLDIAYCAERQRPRCWQVDHKIINGRKDGVTYPESIRMYHSGDFISTDAKRDYGLLTGRMFLKPNPQLASASISVFLDGVEKYDKDLNVNGPTDFSFDISDAKDIELHVHGFDSSGTELNQMVWTLASPAVWVAK